MSILTKVGDGIVDLSVIVWDNVIALLNLVAPKLKQGEVVPRGAAGHRGIWPEYVPPKDGDSRSACPMLNAMANHGILPHDGKNITFTELNQKVRQTFNFAASFCFFVPNFSARFLERSYSNDCFDLADLSLHADNAIEHDASLTRQDVALVQDQGKPDLGLVRDLLEEATGKMADGTLRLTKSDLSRALSKRRADARRTNPHYSESFFHNMFGSAKYDYVESQACSGVYELKSLQLFHDVDDIWRACGRPKANARRRALFRPLGTAYLGSVWVDHGQVQRDRAAR